MTGNGFTVMTVVVEELQPFASVPMVTYVTLVVGAAVTVTPEVALNPVEGPHWYETAPEAVRDVFVKMQMESDGGVTETMGNGLTVTTRVAVLLQPFALVPVTVNVVVTVGDAETPLPVETFKAEAGDQTYEVAPEPNKEMELP